MATTKLDLLKQVRNSLPVTNGGTGVASTTVYAPIFGGTTTTGALQSGTVGTTGQVLTSNGAGALPTFQAAPAPTGGTVLNPYPIWSTIFESVSRFTDSSTGVGTAVVGVNGLNCDSGVTALAGSGMIKTRRGIGDDLIVNSIAGCMVRLDIKGTAGEIFFSLGDLTALSSGQVDYTKKHIGFKVYWNAGTANLHATQGDGTTENASSSLTTVAVNDTLELYFKINGSSSVDYYWSKNGSAFSSATNLTSNMPTAAGSQTETISLGLTNLQGTSESAAVFDSAYYQRY